MRFLDAAGNDFKKKFELQTKTFLCAVYSDLYAGSTLPEDLRLGCPSTGTLPPPALKAKEDLVSVARAFYATCGGNKFFPRYNQLLSVTFWFFPHYIIYHIKNATLFIT